MHLERKNDISYSTTSKTKTLKQNFIIHLTHSCTTEIIHNDSL